MGTVASPNLVIALIDLSTGALDAGETVELILHGDDYVNPGDRIAVPEIGATGYYKIETAGGVAALAQGIYEVWVGGTFKDVITHGNTALQDHIVNVSDPHAVAAAQVTIIDSGGHYSGSDVEAALQELGADLATKADSDGTLLLDISAQSVDSLKPTVTNLDADRVDGAHVGTDDGKIPLISTSQVAGRVDVSLLGIEAGAGAGNLPVLDGSAHVPHANLPPLPAIFLGGLKTGPADGYMMMLDGVIMSADNGYVMHRPGSIVGIGGMAEVTISDTQSYARVYKNGVYVSRADFPLGTGWKKATMTEAQGTDTFVAGDILQLYFDRGGSSSAKNVSVFVEVVFD